MTAEEKPFHALVCINFPDFIDTSSNPLPIQKPDALVCWQMAQFSNHLQKLLAWSDDFYSQSLERGEVYLDVAMPHFVIHHHLFFVLHSVSEHNLHLQAEIVRSFADLYQYKFELTQTWTTAP